MTTVTNPIAFDAFASDYDDDFTHSPLGQLLRPRVWHLLGKAFSSGQHALELTCGTGEDAVWLARRGARCRRHHDSSRGEHQKLRETCFDGGRSMGHAAGRLAGRVAGWALGGG
ncbi:MAG: hypothetical protein AAF485_11165, partial [Chloroflexota bacterium]